MIASASATSPETPSRVASWARPSCSSSASLRPPWPRCSACWRRRRSALRCALVFAISGARLSGSPYVRCAARTNDSTSGSRSGPACSAGTCSSRSCGACTPRRRALRQFERQRPCLSTSLPCRPDRKKPPAPGPRYVQKNSDRSAQGRLRSVAGEPGRSLVELVELEAAGKGLLAVVLEQVVRLLVVEDGAGARWRRGVVSHDRAAREVLELLDRPQPLLGVGLIPVVAVGEGDRLADVGSHVDLRLGPGAAAAAGGHPGKGECGNDEWQTGSAGKPAEKQSYGLAGVVNQGQPAPPISLHARSSGT